MIDLVEIQKKWQERWDKEGIFKAEADPKKMEFYCLEMFPYPSNKLHMGHLRNYSLGDSFARFKRMQGYNVLYPMGYDSFGLPAENAAIKHGVDPKKWTYDNIEAIRAQQKMMGLSYDWSREVITCSPDYYKWNQWIFLKMFEKGLVYRKKSIVNWCSKCNTVLANEQVQGGRCWRHQDTEAEQKELVQWFFKITDYAEELLEDIKKLDKWPERVRVMQENWIGKSHGVTLTFDVVDESGQKVDTVDTFTTRVDTAYGITYLVLAAEHPKVLEWTKGTSKEKEVQEFICKVRKQSIIERTAEGKEKNGVFLGKYFVNPFTRDKCPLWVADYALYDYGTGAVMAVPAHDQRDFEFAKKYNLPIKVVINSPMYDLDASKMSRAYTDDGVMINSQNFDGMNNRDAMDDIAKLAQKKGWGKKTVNYKLKDWLISRQRYWGTPIPIVHCEKCGTVAVPEKELPVLLPEDVDFSSGGNPLETSKSFNNVNCPKCNSPARRETDTMDTFVDSSWYFLRYCSPKETKKPFDEEANYWMPVDQYIGGIEHACMHLIYARFFTKALRDMGLIKYDEPFKQLLTQGMVLKDGAKMSKSLGNTVDPGPYMQKYGADSARHFILFTALPEKELDWSDAGVEGSFRFLKRFIALLEDNPKKGKINADGMDQVNRFLLSKLNRTIQETAKLFEEFKISLALGQIVNLVNEIYKVKGKIRKEVLFELMEKTALILSPVAPHICEEVWETLGNKSFISMQSWPKVNERLIDESAESAHETIEKTRKDILKAIELSKIEKPKEVRMIVSPSWKFKVFKNIKQAMQETRNVGEIIKKVMDEKHKQEIPKIVQMLLKDPTKMPEKVTNQENELNALKSHKDYFEELTGASIVLERAEESKDSKSLAAAPGRLAIIVK